MESLKDTLPALPDGEHYAVSAYPRLDFNPEETLEVRVSAVRRSKVFGIPMNRILAEAWYIPELHGENAETPKETIRRLAGELAAKRHADRQAA